jgi:hypothetical protein
MVGTLRPFAGLARAESNRSGGAVLPNATRSVMHYVTRHACEELADDVRALATLVHALRGALVTVGMVKGGA